MHHTVAPMFMRQDSTPLLNLNGLITASKEKSNQEKSGENNLEIAERNHPFLRSILQYDKGKLIELLNVNIARCLILKMIYLVDQ